MLSGTFLPLLAYDRAGGALAPPLSPPPPFQYVSANRWHVTPIFLNEYDKEGNGYYLS